MKKVSAFCPAAVIEKAKANAKRCAWAGQTQKAVVAAAEPWRKMSDDERWRLRRAHILESMQQVMGPLKDGIFEVSGVKDCIAAAVPVYALLGAKGKLVAVYPAGGHDFPPDVRNRVYEFLDAFLSK